MLPQRYRLRRSQDIIGVRQQGKSWRHPLVILLVKANDQPVSRFGFVTSRHIGNAVVRNRAKRWLREAVHHRLGDIQNGWDCLFIARTPLPSASFVSVEKAVWQLLSQAHLLDKTGRVSQ